jgi:hypothetical protein
MYPNRRGPMPPRRPISQPPQVPRKNQDLLSLFRDPDGNIDFHKINGTAKQMKQLYDQVSPLLSKFLKK